MDKRKLEQQDNFEDVDQDTTSIQMQNDHSNNMPSKPSHDQARGHTNERLETHRYVNLEPFDRHKTRLSGPLDDVEETCEDAKVDDDNLEDAHEIDCDIDRVHRSAGQCQYVDQEDDLDQSQQLDLLRNLLRVERMNNEKSRSSNRTLKDYIQQLQMDFLKQQNDVVEALEFAQKLKSQKDSQIAAIEQTVRDKDALIEQMRANIENLGEAKLRQEFEATLDKQKQLEKLEQDQLRQQIELVGRQLEKERAQSDQLSQQLERKLDEQRVVHERELAAMCSRYKQTQAELERLLSEPQNLVLKALKEDKAALECRVDELVIVCDQVQMKHDNLKKRLEALIVEQGQNERRNQDEVEALQEHYAEQRKSLGELKLELEDKKEVIQILQFNLQRSEKRVKNLLGVMKNKEETYREMVAEMEVKHLQQLEKSKIENNSVEKQLIVNGSDLTRKQNELVRMRLEHENQMEALRNERDERINKISLEKMNLEQELKATELKLAREMEQAGGKTRLIEQLHKEVKQFRDESKRLSIELTKSEAKLYAKQQELNESLNRLNLQRANSQAQIDDAAQVHQLATEVDEERRLAKKLNVNIEELKKENGKLNTKLRIAEANLDRMTTAINREHNKMVREYEKKLEQIRAEQLTFDKSKMRYKRYGYRLKKYCEHLRRVHEHLCNPTVCGYILGPVKAAPIGTSTNTSPSTRQTDKKADRCDKMSLLSCDNYSEEDESYLGEGFNSTRSINLLR